MYFKNNTGDAGLDHWRNALADLLITDLTSIVYYVKVLSEDKALQCSWWSLISCDAEKLFL